MTDDEQLVMQGRITTNYVETKSRLEASVGEAQKLIRDLHALADQLQNFDSAPLNNDITFMDAPRIQKLLMELRQTSREKKQLEQYLRNMAVDVPKDR